ncbi:hypothetical protein A0128_03705 [Leptospira tipperaryensis]|uniref:Outer membrane protein beta-barrel domain-containing protein n=1 Tax=Leptospira tipperaryensis TaxID=2564040 RepID=A0A1D7UU26_9LEPT|nr:hypothetical protein [Leptospira tipperaryensis]AOP33044.1 hypothetical protein A0128_03705 [Leptospira tipperaryensis]
MKHIELRNQTISIRSILCVFLFCFFALPSFAETKSKDKDLQDIVPFAQANVETKTEPVPAPVDPKKVEAERRVDQRKGTWSFQWGYNRDYYTQSDITFKGPGYNFTLKDVVAKDKPEKLDPSVYLNPSLWEIPQYNFRLTYYFADKFFIAFGQDHMKYVMSRGQASNINGYIDPLAIQRAHLGTASDMAVYLYLFPDAYKRLEGYHDGETISVTPDFLKFEHTDGLNFLYMDVGTIQPLWVSTNGEHAFSFVSSVGGGPIIARSDVRLFGEGKNNHFHASGYGVSGYVAGRTDLYKSFFFEFGAKGGYIDLPNIFTTGRSKDRASQNFGFLEIIVFGGVNF